MIINHIDSQASFEPSDLDQLQAAFDALKARFSVRQDGEQAALASILIEAYQRTRDAEAAQQEAARLFAERRG